MHYAATTVCVCSLLQLELVTNNQSNPLAVVLKLEQFRTLHIVVLISIESGGDVNEVFA